MDRGHRNMLEAVYTALSQAATNLYLAEAILESRRITFPEGSEYRIVSDIESAASAAERVLSHIVDMVETEVPGEDT